MALLRQYVAREGHSRVPVEHTEGGSNLGTWVATQRQAHRQGLLTPAKVVQLESVPAWTWDVPDELWERGYLRLQEYVLREGRARMPRNHIEQGFRLGQWVSNQRAAFSRGRLSADRAKRLEALSPWSWNTQISAWDTAFSLLQGYAEREGHTRVPHHWTEEDFCLGQWVGVQRRAFRNGKLGADRAVRLEGLPGWTWDPQEDTWQRGLDLLLQYVEREGHSSVPKRHKEGEFPLGQWVLAQRTSFKRDGISADRRSRLETLQGWVWDVLDTSWQNGLNHLHRYVAREGRARMPSDHEEAGFRLGHWVLHQRSAFELGEIKPERKDALEKIPGWTWHPHADAWTDGYQHLCQYAAWEGHTRVPKAHVEGGFALGQWVGVQRRAFRNGRLRREREGMLEGLPGWTWDALAGSWEEGFEVLSRYVEREGHSRVPQRHVEGSFLLGQWASNQRRSYIRSTLEAPRSRRLEALVGWSWGVSRAALSESRSRGGGSPGD